MLALEQLGLSFGLYVDSVTSRCAIPDPTAPIIVGVDGSAVSEAALAFAVDEAALRSVPLVAHHVWSDTAHQPGAQSKPFVLDWNAIREAEEDVLTERLAGWQDRYPEVQIRSVVERDRPAHGLIRQSARARHHGAPKPRARPSAMKPPPAISHSRPMIRAPAAPTCTPDRTSVR